MIRTESVRVFLLFPKVLIGTLCTHKTMHLLTFIFTLAWDTVVFKLTPQIIATRLRASTSDNIVTLGLQNKDHPWLSVKASKGSKTVSWDALDSEQYNTE